MIIWQLTQFNWLNQIYFKRFVANKLLFTSYECMLFTTILFLFFIKQLDITEVSGTVSVTGDMESEFDSGCHESNLEYGDKKQPKFWEKFFFLWNKRAKKKKLKKVRRKKWDDKNNYCPHRI